MNEAPSKRKPTNGLVCTNPVWSLCQLWHQAWDPCNPGAVRDYANDLRIEWERNGVVLPHHAVDYLTTKGVLPKSAAVSGAKSQPRIVGLVIDDPPEGFVSPIRAERSAHWEIPANLPFHTADIQALLVKLLSSVGQGFESAIPEAVAFRFTEMLGLECDGESMHIAAVLAIFDALNGWQSDIFSRACSLVRPGPQSKLLAVGGGRLKLDAFRREYGRGSLLVRSSRCSDSDEFCSQYDCFSEVWTVDSLEDLFDKLDNNGLLSALLQSSPLDVSQVYLVCDRLRYLMDEEHDNAGARDLCRRLVPFLPDDGLPLHLEAMLAVRREDVHRHKGESLKALELSMQFQLRLSELGDASCYEDEIKAATRKAAGLFDQHDFEGVVSTLTHHLEQCESNPRIISADSRARLLNTLARAKAVLSIDGWWELFDRSINLQERVNPPDLTMTRNFLAHALLRAGRLESAESEIDTVEQSPYCDPYSRTFSYFHRAELARRRMKVWPESPAAIDGLVKKDHAYAFFLQACARQHGRRPDSAVDLLVKAEETLKPSIQNDSPENILWFLDSCIALNRAAYAQDNSEWQSRVSRIRRYLAESGNACMQAYYRDVCSVLTDEPSRERAESLLLRIPYL